MYCHTVRTRPCDGLAAEMNCISFQYTLSFKEASNLVSFIWIPSMIKSSQLSSVCLFFLICLLIFPSMHFYFPSSDVEGLSS
jgi:hypothetical protein